MNEESFDLLSIGDASLDVFITPSESETFCQLDDRECILCFTYGDKIPVKSLEFSIGGNAANNSVGAKRLGINSAVILTLGDDDIGNQIIEKLIKEGVNTSYIFRQKDTASNYSSIIIVSGERTIFSYKFPRDYELPDQLPKSAWIYLTSIGEKFESVYSRVVEHVKKDTDVKLAFNPGSRQIRAGTDKLTKVLEVAHIIYINRREAEIITNMKDTQGKEKELLDAVSKLGPEISIVTDGVNGSFVYNGERYLKAGVLPVDSYERTGAGDAFGSGCISALIKGNGIEDALLWGTVNSASVIGYTGAQKGLLNQDSLKEWLQRAKSCGVKVEEF